MLGEKVSHLCRSYQSSLDMSKSLSAEISLLTDWVNEVKPTLSAAQLPVTNLNMCQLKELLASHQVCTFIATSLTCSCRLVDWSVICSLMEMKTNSKK